MVENGPPTAPVCVCRPQQREHDLATEQDGPRLLEKSEPEKCIGSLMKPAALLGHAVIPDLAVRLYQLLL